ncbi:MAG: AzlD domain-containing protein [Actinomycetota bacterium]|nr:AzlD domain-containing protein [Actinomycetota bacterium]
MIWAGVLLASLGCYLLKLAGLSVPESWVRRPGVQRAAAALLVALLSALVAVQTVSEGTRLVLDARVAGVAAGVLALLLRAPFLVVVAVAAAVAAAVRALG